MITFGTLGAARITPGALIAPCKDEPRASVRVVAARDRSRAESFAKDHDIPIVVDSYQQVIEHPEINAVYNPLQIGAHHEWTIKALEAGKHVLCEKSFASNAREAEEMAAVGKRTGLVLMDAFHYRYHPCFIRAKEIFDSGVLGEISEVDAEFTVPGMNPDDIRANYETAGGVTMDIGCYPISWVRHITGEEPTVTSAVAEEGKPRVDLMLKADFRFPSGIIGHIVGDMRNGGAFSAKLTVTGSNGTMTVQNPLVPQSGHKIDVTVNGETQSETLSRRPSYSFQLDAFIDAIENGTPLLTGADDAVNQMRAIDACYTAAGLPLRGL
ncbi:MAG: Gfo/Idh/MocA family oxidoreductase [Proteobacteria bacterium]|jgi:predicted dehydrogenase|nr:Gfo/Idh/MocA family oxidoreductase [Pseudomonadota bacterium]